MKRRWNNDLEKPEAACNGTHPTEKNAKISFTCRFHRKLSLQAVFAVCRLFLFSVLWEFFREFSPEIGSSLLKFLRFELWICSWRILSKAIRRRSYEITSNAPLRPFTIASADDSLEL